jgi:probable DNA metabolism protein
MILFSPQVKSIFTAALLAGIHGDIAVAKTQQENGGLFIHHNSLDADTHDLEKTALTYTSAFGTNLDWLEQTPGIQLKELIQLNLRHRPVNFTLILAAITEALQFGPQYCLQCLSPTARKFADQARIVAHEVHRMLGFIRFTPMDENTLLAKPKLFHHTADLILRQFQGRYPEYKLVLILDNCALAIFRRQLIKEAAEPYLPYLTDAKAEELWHKYYQSQYIDTRKNIPLAQQRIPQKYWDWLGEGKILKAEKRK